MSEFEVKVVQIEIEEHPNADALELAAIGGYRAIVKKDRFKTGDYVAYVPEGALMPEWLLKQEMFWDADKGKGILAGGRGDRVKPIKLRGILSEGVTIRPHLVDANNPSRVLFGREKEAFLNDPEGFKAAISESYDEECRMDHLEEMIWVNADDDVTDFFGITKWEPPIPVHMTGESQGAPKWTIKYDIENIKKYNKVLEVGEDVAITEKLHGTFAQIGYVPEEDLIVISSKGLGAKGIILKSNEANENNLYVRTANMVGDDGLSIIDKIKEFANVRGEPVYILGEIFGRGVQDLMYGQDTPVFRAFDMYVGKPQAGKYFNFDDMIKFCEYLNIETVPILYRGPYDHQMMLDLTDGKETVSGKSNNIREGVVIKPTIERECKWLSRIILKSVSVKYLTRKGGTELN